jgi:hypothetical protein
MALARQYMQSRDAGGYIIRSGGALQYTPININFTLTQGASVTSVTAPNAGSANAYIMTIELGNLGTNGAVWMLPSASPTLTAPNGTPTESTIQLVPQHGTKRVVTPGQVIQFLYVSAGSSDVIDVGLSFYANSASNFNGGPNG